MADTIRLARPLLPHVDTATPAHEICDQLERWGAVVIENAAVASDIDQVNAELAPWYAQTPACEGLFMGQTTRRFSGVFAKAPHTATLALNPLVLNVVETVLRGRHGVQRCDNIQLNLTQAIAIDPEQTAQPIHRDESMYPFAHDFEVLINTIWALDDFTAENGATCIAPMSHTWPRDRRAEPHEIVDATTPAGSVIMWLGGTLHGGGANKSVAPRRGLVFNYSLGWLNQAEKLLLTTPPDVARTLPERLQRLIGYQVHRPGLGWIEQRDPHEWLHGRFADVARAQDHFTPELEARLAQLFGARRSSSST